MSASRPTTTSPSSVTIRRSTPWVDGWLGPKLTVIRSSPSGGSILDWAPGGICAGCHSGTTGGGWVLGGAHTASVNWTGSPPIG